MFRRNNVRWILLAVANVAMWCVLGFYGGISQAQQGGRPTLANPVEQRGEMVRLLHEINASLKEQNALLRSGKLQVVVQPAAP